MHLEAPIAGWISARRVLGITLLAASLCVQLTAASTQISTPQVIDRLRQFFPDSDPRVDNDPAKLVGLYRTGTFGETRRLYLFPDQTYFSTWSIDIGNAYDDGHWSVADGLLRLESDETGTDIFYGKVSILSPVSLDPGDFYDLITLFTQTNPEPLKGRRVFLSRSVPKSNDEFLFQSLHRVEDLKAADIPSLRSSLGQEYGKGSAFSVLVRFITENSFSVIEKLADGSFVVRPIGSTGGTALMGSPTRLENPRPGIVEIKVADVKFRARRIEINRELNTFRFTGAVEVIGGKLPEKPGLTLYIEGKQVLPAP